MIKIVVISGKGVTGKTMVAASLAEALATYHNIQLLDCNVEAPNAHLFLGFSIFDTQPANILIQLLITINVPCAHNVLIFVNIMP